MDSFFIPEVIPIEEVGELIDPSNSPEESAIFNQTLEQLSSEAKFVLKIILDCPHQLVNTITGDISITKLKRFLSYLGWSQKEIILTICEIKDNFLSP